MGNLRALVESLEDRRLFTVTPIVVTTFDSPINPQIAVLGDYAVMVTMPATQSNAGTLYEYIIPGLSTSQPNVLSFGASDSSNTLGIDPYDVTLDEGGNIVGDAEAGGADATGQGTVTATGGTLWSSAVAGLTSSDALAVETPLNFSRVSNLTRQNGYVYGLGVQNNSDGSSTSSIFEYSNSTGLITLENPDQAGTPTTLVEDNAGDAFVLFNTGSAGGSFVAEYVAGQSGAPAEMLGPFSSQAADQATGMAIDGLGNLFLTFAGATSAIVEVPAGSSTPVTLATWTSASMPALENPVLGPSDAVFATAYNPESPSTDAAALLVLPAGQTTFKTVTDLNSASALTGLVESFATSNGSLYGVMGESIVEFQAADLALLESGASVVTTFSQAPAANLVSDSAGNIFGTLGSLNSSAGSLFEIPAGTSTPQTIADFGPNDSTNTLGINPYVVGTDAQGDVFGSCTAGGPDAVAATDFFAATGGSIWEWVKATSSIKVLTGLVYSGSYVQVAGNGAAFYGTDGTLTSSEAANSDGAFVWTAAGGLLQQIASYGSEPTQPYVYGFTMDARENAYMYLVGLSSAEIDVYTPTTSGGYSGTASSSFDPFTTAPFDTGDAYKYAISSDSAGNLYVTNSDEPTVLSVIKAGTQTITPLATLPAGYNTFRLDGFDTAGDLYVFASGIYPAILELPAGKTAFTVQVTDDDNLTGLTDNPDGNLFGVINDSVVEFSRVVTPVQPPANPTLTGLQPAILAAKLPIAAISSQLVRGAARVELMPLVDGAKLGNETTTLYAVSSDQSIPVGHMTARYKTAGRALAETIHFSTRLPAGTYSLIAQSIDAAGDAVDSTREGTITIAVAIADVVAKINTAAPHIAAGHNGAANVLLSSTGNIPATGPLILTITAGTYVLATETIHLRNFTRTHRLRIGLKIPADVPMGSYALAIAFTWNGQTATASSTVSVDVT